MFRQPCQPHFHVLFGEEGSDFGIETNAKRIGKVFFPAKYIIAQLFDVMINISTRVSLQWFKLNRKKSAAKVTHNKSARNVEQVFVTRSFTVAHEVKAIVTVDGVQLEPAHNGKISMRSPSPSAITLLSAI